MSIATTVRGNAGRSACVRLSDRRAGRMADDRIAGTGDSSARRSARRAREPVHLAELPPLLSILGASAKRRGTPERRAYDAFRAGLGEGGNAAARLYARWLERTLDRVARFFSDSGMGDRTLFPHAFGLRRPAPLWTAPAFDRCLLIALIYPIATVFLFWVASGHVGPAEAALRLESGLPGWRRAVVGVAIALAAGSPAVLRPVPATSAAYRTLAPLGAVVSVGGIADATNLRRYPGRRA
jgi:hypothetical protein